MHAKSKYCTNIRYKNNTENTVANMQGVLRNLIDRLRPTTFISYSQRARLPSFFDWV